MPSNQIFPSAASAVDGNGLINYFPQAQFSNKIPFLRFNFWCNFISSFPFPGVDFFKNEKKKKARDQEEQEEASAFFLSQGIHILCTKYAHLPKDRF